MEETRETKKPLTKAEKNKRYYEKYRQRCLEAMKSHYINNREHYVTKAKDNYNKRKGEQVHCECCNKDILKVSWKDHIQTKRHLNLSTEINN